MKETARVRRGHVELAVRGGIALLQCAVSLVLCGCDVDVAHSAPTALCQLVSGATLALQYAVAGAWDVSAFRTRGAASVARCAVLAHAAACGQGGLGAPSCDAGPWRGPDARRSLRALHVFGAARMLANAASLVAQAATPRAVSATRGHAQLRARSAVRVAGVPLNVARALLKLLVVPRAPIEIGANLLRGLVLIPLSAASLRRQWLTGGGDRAAPFDPS